MSALSVVPITDAVHFPTTPLFLYRISASVAPSSAAPHFKGNGQCLILIDFTHDYALIGQCKLAGCGLDDVLSLRPECLTGHNV